MKSRLGFDYILCKIYLKPIFVGIQEAREFSKDTFVTESAQHYGSVNADLLGLPFQQGILQQNFKTEFDRPLRKFPALLSLLFLLSKQHEEKSSVRSVELIALL